MERGHAACYYDAPSTPIPGPWLVVNGEGGPINNLCVPSEAAPSYAPPGRALVSATILGAGEPDLEQVERQLRGWFGSSVAELAPSADLPDSAGVARVPVGGFGAQPVASRRASTPAATTGSIPR